MHYTGSLDAAVRIYAHPGDVTGALAPHLKLTVEQGTGGGFGSCTGFTPTHADYTGTLADFAATRTDYPSGSGTAAAPGDTQVWRFTAEVEDNNTAQGLSAAASFTWEAQNLPRSAYARGTVSDGAVGYYRLGESSGPQAADTLGAAPGTYPTTGLTLGTPGALIGDTDTAATFDGSHLGVDLGDRYNFEGRKPFTIEAWINPSIVDNNYRAIAADYTAGADTGWTLWSQREFGIGFERHSGGSANTGVPLSPGSWHHVVGAYDGTTLRIYVDGVLRRTNTDTSSVPANLSHAYIGSWTETSDGIQPFAGGIDDVAIYPYALTAGQVSAHYAAAGY